MFVAQIHDLLCSFSLQSIVSLTTFPFPIFPSYVQRPNDDQNDNSTTGCNIQNTSLAETWGVRGQVRPYAKHNMSQKSKQEASSLRDDCTDGTDTCDTAVSGSREKKETLTGDKSRCSRTHRIRGSIIRTPCHNCWRRGHKAHNAKETCSVPLKSMRKEVEENDRSSPSVMTWGCDRNNISAEDERNREENCQGPDPKTISTIGHEKSPETRYRVGWNST